jgi:hypothetical protein
MKKIYQSNFSKILLTSLLSSSLLLSCKKETRPTIDTDQKAAQDNAKGQYVFNNVNHIVDDAARSQGGVNKMEDTPCMKVIMDSTASDPQNKYFPKTLTCIFDSTCKAPNGDVRKGKIKIVLTKHISDSGAVITTTFDGFNFNGYKVEGTLTERNNGPDATTRMPSYSFTLPDGKITNSSGEVITLNLSQTKQLLKGKGTTTVSGDSYQLTGSSSGTSAGAAFSASITKPLVFDASLPCQFLISGVLEVRQTGKDLKSIDFGNGTCSGQATLSMIGTTTTTVIINQSGK